MIRSRTPDKQWFIWIALFLVGLAGAIFVVYITRWGAIAYSDSINYVLTARNLLSGKGLGIPGPGGAFIPLRIQAPLYPVVLAGFGLLGIEPLDGARLLAVILFAVSILLIGIIIYRVSHQILLAVLVSAAFAVSPIFLEVFSQVMSEGLFFVSGLLMLFLLLWHQEQPKPVKLITAGLFGGLSFLARYPGVAWVAAGCFALLIFRKVSWKQRLIECLWLCLPSAGVSALWLVPLSLRFQSLVPRSFQFSFDLGAEFETTKAALIDMGWRWVPFSDVLVPTHSYAMRGGLMLGGLAIIILLAVVAVWRLGKVQGKQPGKVEDRLVKSADEVDGLSHLLGFLGLFAGIYLVIVIYSFLFSVPRSDLNQRLLSPLYLAGLLIGVALLHWAALRLQGKVARVVTGLVLLLPAVLIMDGFRRSLPIAIELHRNGDGYTSSTWRDSETIQLLPRLVPPDMELISNQSAAILFLSGRPAFELTELYFDEPLQTFARYGDGPNEPNDMAEQLFHQRKAALVIFPKTLYWQLYPLYGEKTKERIDALFAGLETKGPFHDGVVYFYPEGK
jgi:hypothetical protein